MGLCASVVDREDIEPLAAWRPTLLGDSAWGKPPSVADGDDAEAALRKMPRLALQDVLKAMGLFATLEVRAAGLLRLEALQLHQDEPDQLLALGVPEAVVEAMEAHSGPDAAALQESGCRFLKAAACTPAGQSKVASCGGLKAVIQALKAGGGQQGGSLKAAACAALLALASNCPPNKVKVGALGGIAAVLGAMSGAVEDAQLQERGCACLRTFATAHSSNQTRIAVSGGAAAILNAMRRHEDDVGLQSEGCWALHVLAHGQPNTQKDMAVLGVCQALLQCMGRHPASPGVQEHALRGLKTMCASSPDSAALVAEGDGFALIGGAMDGHRGVPSVVEQALWALCDLVGKDEGRKAAFQAKVGMQKVKDLMAKHSEEHGVRNAGNTLVAVVDGKTMVSRLSIVA